MFAWFSWFFFSDHLGFPFSWFFSLVLLASLFWFPPLSTFYLRSPDSPGSPSSFVFFLLFCSFLSLFLSHFSSFLSPFFFLREPLESPPWTSNRDRGKNRGRGRGSIWHSLSFHCHLPCSPPLESSLHWRLVLDPLVCLPRRYPPPSRRSPCPSCFPWASSRLSRTACPPRPSPPSPAPPP